MKPKNKTFSDWIHDEKIVQLDFAAKTGLGTTTVAGLVAKSKHGVAITLRRATVEKIQSSYPSCPLLVTAGVL